MMTLLRSPEQLREWRKSQSGDLGFVPTMGALHEGHAELLRQARRQNSSVVLSIFVNQTQFNDPKDFEKYPITWNEDLELARRLEVNAVFAPTFEQLYPDNYHYRITENSFSTKLCGAHRPGHFDGVLSVVMKLLNLVQPRRAYFGEKDYQQLRLIEGMVKAFFMNIDIVPVPTVRESDGLAMSSRNRRLSPEQRSVATRFPQILRNATDAATAQALLEQEGFCVDYVEDHDGRRFAAAFLGEVRLIDNVVL